ncbi:hypothetical protein ACFVVU_36050 [Kitasatospora sp. NPDC057965]|uniref:hypothetical protein n=1 Tax=Kitasatospora sp. NPDC057965 TaxID=3346291 RepID=UPI0036DAF1CB
MGKQQTTFEYPDGLIAAHRALEAVQAERRAHLAALPAFSGDLDTAREGLTEEQLAESARLEEAERQAAHAVWTDTYWAGLSGEDRFTARSRLKHTGEPGRRRAKPVVRW